MLALAIATCLLVACGGTTDWRSDLGTALLEARGDDDTAERPSNEELEVQIKASCDDLEDEAESLGGLSGEDAIRQARLELLSQMDNDELQHLDTVRDLYSAIQGGYEELCPKDWLEFTTTTGIDNLADMVPESP